MRVEARANAKRKKDLRQQAGSLANLVNVKEGLVSPRIFVDPVISQLELERIFTRSWLYVAHESEIPDPGDFVTRVMGGDPVIAWRGQDREVRVFLNVCRHRGRRLCGEDAGKAASLRCPYHGWTYGNRGELITVPFFENYNGRLDKGSLGLYLAPRVDTVHGLIFANWDSGAESLSDYLGEMKWALDVLFGRTEGMEVMGPPMRWVVDGNWKVAAGNFAGDPVHVSITHGFATALELGFRTAGGLGDRTKGERRSYRLTTERGHAVSLAGSSEGSHLSLPQELWPEMELRLTSEQLDMMKALVAVVGNVFPNMSILNSGTREPGQWGG